MLTFVFPLTQCMCVCRFKQGEITESEEQWIVENFKPEAQYGIKSQKIEPHVFEYSVPSAVTGEIEILRIHGIRATEDIVHGDVIMSIPKSAIFNLDQMWLNPAWQASGILEDSVLTEAFMPIARLAMYLIYESMFPDSKFR